MLEKLRKTDLALEFIDIIAIVVTVYESVVTLLFFVITIFHYLKLKFGLKNAEFSMRKEKPTVFFHS